MILFMFLMQLKHLVVDFFLQTPYQYLNKGKLGHLGGILHAAMHSWATLLVLLLVSTKPFIVLQLIAFVEFVVHYFIDWGKVQITRRFSWSDRSKDGRCLEIYSNNYFHALGIDQFLHQLTYVAIAMCL